MSGTPELLFTISPSLVALQDNQQIHILISQLVFSLTTIEGSTLQWTSGSSGRMHWYQLLLEVLSRD
jgi:hypothetical protein